ncbi:ketosteroid isomerase family protein [Williamsia sp. 1135]|uniref:ketosteroid isomerase family protein n=1 Tax=Williamsia sp. 1135 TaxID=1889262 RepID=UPI000A1045B9|nr:ketosteroid isomerase family protein [Williamsia sp. 1135]ORM34116.1 hypothetical protein BFL43_11855 [Williamsia sp. 1135]
MPSFDREQMLAVVERSPAAAGAHDRAAWVGLFTDDGIVNDPVGSRPHVGRGEIERFYDTFIGPRRITFHRDVDVVCGRSVMRDVELEVEMSAKVTMRVPVHIRYDLREVGNQLRIERLAAYWELPGMIAQFLRSGIAAAPVATRLSVALMKNQGPRGALGFVEGFRRVGGEAKATVGNFLDAVATGDAPGAGRYLDRAAAVTISGDDAGAHVWATALHGLRAHKYLAAGHTVAVGLKHDDWRGVGLFEFDSGRGPIKAVDVLIDSGA